MRRSTFGVMTILMSGVLFAATAAGEIRFSEGSWRLELSGLGGIHSGSYDREGDFLVNGAVEYEFPATSRCKLGLRLLPLFLYDQDSDGRDGQRNDDRDETVWGGGVGFAVRLYQKRDEYRGFFGEVEGNAIGHQHKFDGNSANLNFLIGCGVGYKFGNAWHVALKYSHISNAGLGGENSGANAVGLGLGYTF
jgi:hypothetical protein